MNALFGSGYPQCRLETKPVGDSYGRIRDDTTGEPWISEPETAQWINNGYVQTRWIQDTDRAGNPINLTKANFDAAKKTYNPDGTPKEGFCTMETMMTRPSTIAVVGVLCLLAFGFVKRR
jgi:hypothetical protein